jgi:hypothetical protein
MSQMKKVYLEATMIASEDGAEFQQYITRRIEKWQNEDFRNQVEVQFSANGTQASALLLKYRMENI